MSFVLGTISGALAAGGVYYGFSNLMSSRTEMHRTDLHRLSQRLLEVPVSPEALPSASQRIVHHPFTSLMKEQWNAAIGTAFNSARDLEQEVFRWGKVLLSEGFPGSKRE
ncbi:hypothetical protein CERSUDRAFT_114782 [Gelatoporia subvermispora B]|uniref:MICOS complex subunit MIC12 n=1 Tax=Ceriporiopsis subvermispora (strain B) TaxID=914234 RepID=M2QXL4_CERS8|nr:hypothetical protein CERSUDRAFT_114782 [Gelatoporia subvermispora B]